MDCFLPKVEPCTVNFGTESSLPRMIQLMDNGCVPYPVVFIFFTSIFH